jgi:hypothetical protein
VHQVTEDRPFPFEQFFCLLPILLFFRSVNKMINLTHQQEQAILHVESMSQGYPLDRSLRITLNFHPDRIHNSLHILDSMVQTGVYKSQFETNTSNGGLSAHPGGDRWKWESRIFGHAYDTVAPQERPKYGALNYKRCSNGASPRFGSAYLRLKENCLDRATYCYPDSYFQPTDFGTAQRMDLIRLALSDNKDLLDDYIEAQIHGELNLLRDVEAIVLDPSYRDTEVEELASKLGCEVEFHDGFTLTIEEMQKYPEYRGVEFIELGKEIAQNGVLTPRIIGIAANTGKYDLQDVKKVWHYLARYGRK